MKTLAHPLLGGSTRRVRLVPVLAVVLAACGGEPAATAPPQPTETPSAAPAPAPEPAPTAAPTASAKASATPEAPKPQSSGRPAVLKSDPNEISDTFGSSPASKLELGDGKDIATLRLPEGALRSATNVTFKIDRAGKATGGQLGKVYRITAVVPPSSTPESFASDGPPFVIELPIGSKKDVNLAVGVEDDKGKIKWTISAPARVDDSRSVAIFELATLPSGWLHVTTKPASK
jgi:hypothetical protein